MLRSARHAKILEIIAHKEIETQEELCEELNKQNYKVAQATIFSQTKTFLLIRAKRHLFLRELGLKLTKAGCLKFTHVADLVLSIDLP